MTAGTLHTRRSLDRPDSRWGRWDVVDDDGQVVGLITEHREWLGSSWGPPSFVVSHRPEPMPARACWNAEGLASVPAAVAALAEHLRDAHGQELAREDEPTIVVDLDDEADG